MNHKTDEIIAVILVIMIILLPFGWIIIYQNPSVSNTGKTSAELVEKTLKDAGFTICSQVENTWVVPGASGGKTFVISPECGTDSQQERIIVHIQKIKDEETKNSIIRGFNSQTRGKPNGYILNKDSYVILVQGHGHGKVVSVLNNNL